MKNYYIVTFNESDNTIHTSKYLGIYEEMCDAKEAAFSGMLEGELLIGFDLNVAPEYTTDFGLETVHLNLAEESEKVYLLKTDDTMEDVPAAGLYYWSDDNQDTYYYTADGELYETQ